MIIKGKMNQYGRSMIEMLGVLAIIGVLSVGGIAGYSKAMMKSKINSTTELLLTIATNVQNATLRTKKYDNLEQAAIKLKAIPDEALNAGRTSLKSNPFNGSIKLGSFQPTASFYVAMNNLPKEACISIASNKFGNALIYAGSGEFSDNTLKNDLQNANFRVANPTCSATVPYYCLKQVMSPAVAAKACSCTNAGGCSIALVMF